jgi:hypothetical protein
MFAVSGKANESVVLQDIATFEGLIVADARDSLAEVRQPINLLWILPVSNRRHRMIISALCAWTV